MHWVKNPSSIDLDLLFQPRIPDSCILDPEIVASLSKTGSGKNAGDTYFSRSSDLKKVRPLGSITLVSPAVDLAMRAFCRKRFSIRPDRSPLHNQNPHACRNKSCICHSYAKYPGYDTQPSQIGIRHSPSLLCYHPAAPFLGGPMTRARSFHEF